MQVPFIDLAAQYRTISPEVNRAIEGVLARNDFILGDDVRYFETEFAAYVGARRAIGVSSGLDALRLVLHALDVGPEDDVILPANTFIATALAVSAVGARPVLVDCDPVTYNIDAALIEAAITRRTKAVIPVHLTGQAAHMDAVAEVAKRHGLLVVEDAAQAQGAHYAGRRCGSIGVAGCFSFYPGKNLGAYGDAGAVTTDDDALANRLSRLRHYGQAAKYEHVELGLNARLDTIQAAVLRVKLRHLDDWNARRAEHAQHYRRLLAELPTIRAQGLQPRASHIYHLFVIETPHRDALAAHLGRCGVQTNIHYPKPIHLQKAYATLGYKAGDFPHSERLAREVLSLPMYAELRPEQVEHVVASIRSFDV